MGENNTQLFSWHWPRDDESIHPIVTSIDNTTILSIVNAAIASLPDPSRKIKELWGCQEEPDGDAGHYACNVTPIFNHNTAAGWVKAAMKISNPRDFCVVYHGQLADGTAGAQMPMRGGHSYPALYVILPPPAEDIMDHIREESDDDGDLRCPTPISFPPTKTGFQIFEQKLQKRIITQQQYLEVIPNCALGLFAE